MSISDLVIIGWTDVFDWLQNLIPLILIGSEG
jgi:hypothetical protein